MHPAEILTHLGERGFCVSYARATKDVDISPTPIPAMAKRIVANEAAIVGYLDSLPHQVALAHPFTTIHGADLKALAERGVCIACGIPWAMHGEPPSSHWSFTASHESVRLVVASPIDCKEALA